MFLGNCNLGCSIVEFLILAYLSLAAFLGYWKFECWNNFVQFSKCNLGSTQISDWNIMSKDLVFRVNSIIVLTTFMDDSGFYAKIGKFIGLVVHRWRLLSFV